MTLIILDKPSKKRICLAISDMMELGIGGMVCRRSCGLCQVEKAQWGEMVQWFQLGATVQEPNGNGACWDLK